MAGDTRVPGAVEVQSPSCLPLGLVQHEGAPALLGIALQYPPIHMLLKPHNELSVTGGRANIARRQALGWFQRRGRPSKAEIEIELAIPAYMGLGSEAMLGLSVERGLALLLNDSVDATDPDTHGREWGLEGHAHRQGGFVAVSADGALLRRHTLEHDDAHAWVFVLHLPHVSRETPASLEAERRQSLLNSAAAGTLDEVWAALAADDIRAFGQALMQLGAHHTPTPEIADSLDVLRTARAAAAWGQSLGGLAAWGLIHGARASQEARQRLRRAVGYEGGTVTASIASNSGARLRWIDGHGI